MAKSRLNRLAALPLVATLVGCGHFGTQPEKKKRLTHEERFILSADMIGRMRAILQVLTSVENEARADREFELADCIQPNRKAVEGYLDLSEETRRRMAELNHPRHANIAFKAIYLNQEASLGHYGKARRCEK